MVTPRNVRFDSAVKKAVRRLRDCYHAMRQAPDHQRLAERWEDFLVAHQRVWNKLEAECRTEKAWIPIRAKLKPRRDNEPALVYLHQARHADEHGLDPVTKVGDGTLKISGPGSMYGMRMDAAGNITTYPGTTVKVTFSPNAVLAKPVSNRGVTYEPPSLAEHHEAPTVLALALIGLQFYEEMLAAFEALHGT